MHEPRQLASHAQLRQNRQTTWRPGARSMLLVWLSPSDGLGIAQSLKNIENRDVVGSDSFRSFGYPGALILIPAEDVM